MKKTLYWTMKEGYWQQRLIGSQRRALGVVVVMSVCLAVEYWLGLWGH